MNKIGVCMRAKAACGDTYIPSAPQALWQAKLRMAMIAAMALVASAACLRTAYAGSCLFSPGSLAYVCRGAANPATDWPQYLLQHPDNDDLIVTTEPGFGIEFSSIPPGRTAIVLLSDLDGGDIVFTDDQGSLISIPIDATPDSTTVGIYAQHDGDGELHIETNGIVTGGAAIFAQHYGDGELRITVSSGGLVSGPWSIIFRTSTTGNGLITIEEGALVQGTITPLSTTPPGGAITISNSGRIIGPVHLTGQDDVFESFRTDLTATNGSIDIIEQGQIDFGGGNDILRNQGIIPGYLGQLPQFIGLETFANNGEIRLQNQLAGDRFTINHDLSAGPNSLLSVDVDFENNRADALVINGDVTGGTTQVEVAVLGGHLGDGSLTVVQVAGTAAETAFQLTDASANQGLFVLTLAQDTDNNFFLCRALSPSSPTGGPIITDAAGDVVRNIFTGLGQLSFRAIPSYSERNAGRQLLSTNGDLGVWSKGFYDAVDIEVMERDEVKIRRRGLLLGIDYAIGSGRIGTFIGTHYVDSRVQGRQFANAELGGATLGAYYSLVGYDWYIDVATEWQYSDIDYDGGAAIGEDSFDSNVWGVALEAGKAVYAAGQTSLQLYGRTQYSMTDVDDANFNGITVSFDDSEDVRISAGVNLSHTIEGKDRSALLVSFNIAAVHEFHDDVGAVIDDVVLLNTPFDDATFAEMALNLSYNINPSVVMTLSADGSVGNGRQGAGIGLGMTARF